MNTRTRKQTRKLKGGCGCNAKTKSPSMFGGRAMSKKHKGGLLATLNTAAVPFGLLAMQKHHQKRVSSKRSSRKMKTLKKRIVRRYKK